jgi:hypothetical protein
VGRTENRDHGVCHGSHSDGRESDPQVESFALTREAQRGEMSSDPEASESSAVPTNFTLISKMVENPSEVDSITLRARISSSVTNFPFAPNPFRFLIGIPGEED